jgi:hypothetical protein
VYGGSKSYVKVDHPGFVTAAMYIIIYYKNIIYYYITQDSPDPSEAAANLRG